MNMDPDRVRLAFDLLKSGITSQRSDPNTVRWDFHTIWRNHIDVLDQAVKFVLEEFYREAALPRYFCAVRASGLVPAALLCRRSPHQVGLIWVRERMVEDVAPRYLNLTGQPITLVDSHTITGRTLAAHWHVMQELSVNLQPPLVLLNLDCADAENENRQILETMGLRYIASWSELHPILEKLQTDGSLDEQLDLLLKAVSERGVKVFR